MKEESLNHPGPKPRLWDLRFIMLTATFALLWIYLVAQGATAFQLVSGGGYWLGLAPALAIEIGEVVALVLWSSEAKSKIKSWQGGTVAVAAVLSAIIQYLAADFVAGDKVGIELKIALSIGVSALAIFLGKSAGERFVSWQTEFQQWKTAEMEWKTAEEERRDQREYERIQEEEKRDYRRKRREEREKLKAEDKGTKQTGIQPITAEMQQFDPETLPDAYKGRLKALNTHLLNGVSVSADEAFIIMKIGKSQGYRILSAGVSAGLLEKSGRKWKQGNGIGKSVSDEIPAETGMA